ncbi:MAG: ribose-phosphate pyrophosphokinase, partial [Nitrosarchaeum sp.]
MTKFTVISGSSSEDLAKKLAKRLGANLLKSQLRIFPDGESKITLKGKLQKNKIIVIQSTYPPVDENLIQTLSIISKAK